MSQDEKEIDGKNKSFFQYAPDTDPWAKELIQEEWNEIKNQRNKPNDKDPSNCVGLSLSGGGIRSATFSLGILQALAKYKWLEKIDYLSTVSGGGYIGSSLTWFFHKKWKLENGDRVQFDGSPEQFPFGVDKFKMDATSVTTEEKKEEILEGEKKIKIEEEIATSYRKRWVRYLRQHGNYLIPGHGITFASLIGVFLRGVIVNLFVYIPILTSIFFLCRKFFKDIEVFFRFLFQDIKDFLCNSIWEDNTHFLCSWLIKQEIENVPLILSIFFLGLFLISSILYSPVAFFAFFKETSWYRLRRCYAEIIKYIIWAFGIFLILGLFLSMRIKMGDFFGSFNLGGSIGGLISIILGLIFASGTIFKSSHTKKEKISLDLLISAGSFFLILGILIICYHFSETLWLIFNEISGPFYIFLLSVGIILPSIFIGIFANLNYLSLHRFYRDRLMEGFMPDVDKIIQKTPHKITTGFTADRAALAEMFKDNAGPYHLINSNIVLVDSKNRKLKRRGGDSFIFSPVFCGSGATGWKRTRKFMGGGMNLPTATAVSSAAINPNAGVGGEGITRNRMLSTLMRFLNLGLGYWALNPDYSKHFPKKFLWLSFMDTPHPEEKQFHKLSIKLLPPNFFYPFFTANLKEDNRFVHLTDGGHFENLGLYELIRRRLKVIIVVDGASDKSFNFDDLANAIEKVRIDFGVTIDLDLNLLLPIKASKDLDTNEPAVSPKGFSIGNIDYGNGKSGKVIYIKTTFTNGRSENLPPDLYSYKKRYPEFPDQTTADQFFDEKQFEAYRKLGFIIGDSMVNSPEVKEDEIISAALEIDQKLGGLYFC